MINVLIVDDSLTSREYLKQIIASDPELAVIGEARDGKEALMLAEKKRPHVIVMDILMPGLNGYEATRAIMETCPTPIVINSALATPGQTEVVFQAMKAGAVAVCQKPAGFGQPESAELIEKLIRMIKLMSEVKVVRLLYPKKKLPGTDFTNIASFKHIESRIDIIAIGASTGGPPVLHTILSSLNKNFSTPMIVVQHIAAGFLEGMIEWLSKETALTLKIPKTGERIQAGHVYFSPEDHHMEITPSRHFMITKMGPNELVKRPITHLFNSIAKTFHENSVGILLTGMGADGAQGLKEMNSKGALTLAQSKESSVVFGMPGEAVNLKAATYIFSPAEIASFLNTFIRN
jgi:two-component system, chemotaxis family, protein-glutamate methylesterase/glutaminase